MPKQIDEDLLIKAAAEFFAERGYAGAGVAEIARRAGVTTGAIYSRYSGKSELLLEALKRSFVLHFGDAIASALSDENRAENFDQDGVGIRSMGCWRTMNGKVMMHYFSKQLLRVGAMKR